MQNFEDFSCVPNFINFTARVLIYLRHNRLLSISTKAHDSLRPSFAFALLSTSPKTQQPIHETIAAPTLSYLSSSLLNTNLRVPIYNEFSDCPLFAPSVYTYILLQRTHTHTHMSVCIRDRHLPRARFLRVVVVVRALLSCIASGWRASVLARIERLWVGEPNERGIFFFFCWVIGFRCGVAVILMEWILWIFFSTKVEDFSWGVEVGKECIVCDFNEGFVLYLMTMEENLFTGR